MSIKREFTIAGIEFVVGNYRPRQNEFERGLKYMLLVKENCCYYDTGMRGCTIKECKEYAKREIARWL